MNMTIRQAIDRVDALKFNTYHQTDKIQWLSRLDWNILHGILELHDGTNTDFTGYDDNTDPNTQLLVPPPYDEVYIRWLEAQIDYHNGEYDKYNASITMYNTAFEAFANYYKRSHMPKPKGSRFLF